MEKEVEEQDSKELDEVEENQETESQEEQSEESELHSKNRQLFERAKKAELKAKENEAEIQRLEARLSDNDDSYDDDETEVRSEIKELRAEIKSMEEERKMHTVLERYPILNEKIEEFDLYREEYKGVPLETAAKAYLVENDLLGETAKRKGLEPAKGGKKSVQKSNKMTWDDVKRLRENDYIKYKQMLADGLINVTE